MGAFVAGLQLPLTNILNLHSEMHKSMTHQRWAYLCGSCHDRVTRGIWSKQKVMDARSEPWCIKNHRCHDSFDISAPNPVIWVGPNEIVNINKILSIDDHVILAIDPPEQTGAPYTISGEFFDDSGNLLFKIDKN